MVTTISLSSIGKTPIESKVKSTRDRDAEFRPAASGRPHWKAFAARPAWRAAGLTEDRRQKGCLA